MARNEVFITAVCIIAMLFLAFAAGQPLGGSLFMFILVAYGLYCGYHYSPKKNSAHTVVSLAIFIVFIATSQLDQTVANIMATAWLASLLYYAMNADTTAIPVPAQPDNVVSVGTSKYCKNCGAPLTDSDKFCGTCGNPTQA